MPARLSGMVLYMPKMHKAAGTLQADRSGRLLCTADARTRPSGVGNPLEGSYCFQGSEFPIKHGACYIAHFSWGCNERKKDAVQTGVYTGKWRSPAFRGPIPVGVSINALHFYLERKDRLAAPPHRYRFPQCRTGGFQFSGLAVSAHRYIQDGKEMPVCTGKSFCREKCRSSFELRQLVIPWSHPVPIRGRHILPCGWPCHCAAPSRHTWQRPRPRRGVRQSRRLRRQQ